MELDYSLSSEYILSTSKTLLRPGKNGSPKRHLYHSCIDSKPDLSTLVYLKNDYNLSKEIPSDLLLKSLAFLQDKDELVVKKEFFEGTPLSDLIGQRIFSIEECFRISNQLAQLLLDVHSSEVVLRELNPSNILINEGSLKLKLAVTGGASKLSKEKTLGQSQFQGVNELKYIAPEQSGRVGRHVDFRTDFYSLGCIIYALLSGGPPFNSSNARRLVHAHIAVPPQPIGELRKDIPELLQKVITKLLNKNPEDRYQNAAGLLYDLDLCVQDANKVNRGDLLGTKDYSNRLLLSEKIYGREKEIEQLNEALRRTSEGNIEIILVEGYSGIGKTRLIGEFEKTIIKYEGVYASGKFDQFKRDTPYVAVIQAFNELVNGLIANEADRIDKWRARINNRLRGSGGAILEHIPTLEIIMGAQDPVYPLGATESKNRLFNCFYTILSVLEHDDIPIVLFLDDLQWIDSGSLELILYLLNSDLKKLLLIGAFRDNEVPPSHPLAIAIKEIYEKQPEKISSLKIGQLNVGHIQQFISDTFRQEGEEITELSEELKAKSGGNPFFFKQLIVEFERDGIIEFDGSHHKWIWDIESIRAHEVTDNVVDLLIVRLSNVDSAHQDCLGHAACIGNQFDLKTLELVSNVKNEQLADILSRSIEEGYISSNAAWSEDLLDEELTSMVIGDQTEIIFKFQHDKIQQACYSLIPDSQLEATHLKIGKVLWDTKSEEDISEEIFDLLTHLNIASPLLCESEEVLRLAKLNLSAGRRALQSNALEPARLYFNKGMALVSDMTDSNLYKELLIASSECEYLNGNHEKSEKLFDEALEKEESSFHKADILSRKMALYENTQQHLNAIEAAIEGLALLGISLPENPDFDEVLAERGRLNDLLGDRSIQSLLELDLMQSQESQLASKILMNLFGPAYLVARPMLIAWASLRMVSIAIQNGNCPETAFGYALYGFMASVTFADYAHGYDYAKVGIDLNERLGDRTLRSRVLVMAVGCTAHWREPYAEISKNMYLSYRAGVEANDIIWAGYSITHYNRSIIFSSEALPTTLDKLKSVVHFTRQIQSDISTQQLLAWIRMVENLMLVGQHEEEYGSLASYEEHLNHAKELSEAGIPLALANFYIAQGMRSLILNQYEIAEEFLDMAQPISISVYGLEEWAELHYLIPITKLVKAIEDGELKEEVSKQIEDGMPQLESWASLAPLNYSSKYHFIQALRAVVNRKYDEALQLYQEALSSASEANLHYIGGLINEHWANLLNEMGQIDESEARYKMAYLSYRDWGANEKLRAMESNHSFLMSSYSSTSGKGGREVGLSEAIDLESVFMASMSIAGEKSIRAIVKNLLELAAENAGAQKATFVGVDEGELYVEADLEINRDPQIEFYNERVSVTSKLPRSIIHAVNSGREAIIIGDAKGENRFANDPYFREGSSRSVLASPVIYKQEVRAIIYLENTLSAFAFTSDHLRIMQLLSGQIAISMENANLVENLERKVARRTSTIEAQKEIIEREKKKSDSLLLNILPMDIANELKERGSYLPRTYDDVTIMFTDFESFTAFTHENGANEVVDYIDQCYKAFDEIVRKYRIEKIKTIGDSYMCASGIPIHYQEHALEMVQAADEIMRFLSDFNEKRKKQNRPYCKMRIGVHTGPVIAGVVGHHKFAYDIWGDSVNTASRMESSSEVGRINISESTYQRIKGEFNCTPRGKVELKNLGAINMYFVD